MTLIEEINDLLGRNLSAKENKRMFQIYRDLSGLAIRTCNCASKIKRVRNFLKNYLQENGG